MKYGVIGEYVKPLFLETFQVKFVANKSSLKVESFFNFNLSIPHFIVVSNPPPTFGVITSKQLSQARASTLNFLVEIRFIIVVENSSGIGGVNLQRTLKRYANPCWFAGASRVSELDPALTHTAPITFKFSRCHKYSTSGPVVIPVA